MPRPRRKTRDAPPCSIKYVRHKICAPRLRLKKKRKPKYKNPYPAKKLVKFTRKKRKKGPHPAAPKAPPRKINRMLKELMDFNKPGMK